MEERTLSTVTEVLHDTEHGGGVLEYLGLVSSRIHCHLIRILEPTNHIPGLGHEVSHARIQCGSLCFGDSNIVYDGDVAGFHNVLSDCCLYRRPSIIITGVYDGIMTGT